MNEYDENCRSFLDVNEDSDIPTAKGENSSIQDNIMKAVQNENEGRIMSEESEAFFWDWILQKE